MDTALTVSGDQLGVITFSSKLLSGATEATLRMFADVQTPTTVELYVLSTYTPDGSLCYNAIADKLTATTRMGSFDVVDGAVAFDVSILSRLTLGKNVTLVVKAQDTSAITFDSARTMLVSNTNAEVMLAEEDRPVGDVAVDFAEITAAQVTIGSDLTVKFFASVSRTYADAKLRVTVNGKETVLDGARVGGEYVYVLGGLAYGQMNDTIKAELVLNDTVLALRESYSVAQNFKNLSARSASSLGLSEEKATALRQLLGELSEKGISQEILGKHDAKGILN